MLYLALHMARHRIAALLAIACATLGGAAFVTGIGVLAESGLALTRAGQPARRRRRRRLGQPDVPAGRGPADRAAGARAGYRASWSTGWPAARRHRRDRRRELSRRRRRRARRGGTGRRSAQRRARLVLDRAAGRAARDRHSAGRSARGRPGPGHRRSRPAWRRATRSRSSPPAIAPCTASRPWSPRAQGGIFFADPTAMRLAGRDRGSAAGTVDLVALRHRPGRGGLGRRRGPRPCRAAAG